MVPFETQRQERARAMTSEKTKPICACCLEPIGAGPWRVTEPKVYVLCGAGGCERWAWAQGLRFYSEGRSARPWRRRKHPAPRCDGCGAELPKGREPFRDGKRPFCTLTCMKRSLAR